MVIPVYDNYGIQLCNLCCYVTEQEETDKKQGLDRLHKSNVTQYSDIILCNRECLENEGDVDDGNKVTQVTKPREDIYWLDRFEEKAAIYEYEANMTRLDAEEYAIYDLVNELIETNEKKDWDEAMRYLFACGIPNPYWK